MHSQLARRLTIGMALALLVLLTALPALGAAPAGFTTTNPLVDGPDHCKNGNEAVNCNIYDGKEYVWLNGGPVGAELPDGDYFFAVLEPGGQANPNDGAVQNLSDDFDFYTNRTFSVSSGAISYGGSHDFANNKIRLMPYADTPNPGGVYVMAICSLGDGYPVEPSTCKYDAFKVQESDTEIEYADPLTVVKDADGAYDNSYSWTIDKEADKTLVRQVGGNAEFTYTVTVEHDGGVISAVTVMGTITVFNPNEGPGNTILPVDIDGVTDELSDGTVCTVTGGGPQTLTEAETSFEYECALAGLPEGELNNTVTVTWPEQFLADGSLLLGGSADFTFETILFTENPIDECVDVDDSYAGFLGTVCVGDENPTEFTYGRTIPVPDYGCQDYDNTATFTANDTGATGSAEATVTVCGPIQTGARTIGFWQNKNGQNIIKNEAKTGTCPSATWLRQYAPFQDLSATASCKTVAGYVANVIKAANASGASMNKMLKAQMLATALDVYFSDPALGGNKLGAPQPLGGVTIDLTYICTDLTCTTFQDVGAAFGGATSMTVSEALAYAASQSNVGGSTWYGNVKATQELAKDTFDAINNEVVFAP